MRKILFATTAFALGFVAVNTASANERTMIVLDGSGSMWGQIDGVPKLQIARDTLREVLKSVPDTTELGLMAYGHRKKGDCSDIELVVPPALGTANAIVEKADNMKFLGKTPLTAAVKKAAEELRYTEDPATVVLITDGLETCEANVCELGELLAEQGQGFTAHVVGFGLTKEEGKQVACLAENTGGQYFSANDGEGLIKALQQTVIAVVPTVTLTPIDQDGKEVKDLPMSWSVADAASQEIESQNSQGKIATKLNEGSYSVSITGPEVAGGGTFDVVADKRQQNFDIPVEVSRLEATLDAPKSAIAGSEITVAWQGPDHPDDYITIVEKGARDGAYTGYAYTANGSPATFTVPDGLGEYEVRYVHANTTRTLASSPIELTEVTGSIDGPAQVAAGSEFDVNWTGPNYYDDFVTIVEKGAPEGSYKSYEYTRDESPARIKAPDQPGLYELRYVVANGERTLVSKDIEVTAVSATLTAPKSIPAGAQVTVEWVGPNNNGDYITIVAQGAAQGTFTGYAYTANGSPAIFHAPDASGPHEIRYVNGGTETTLAAQPIELTPISAKLEVISELKAGQPIEVVWEGPNNSRDFITIVDVGAREGAYKDYAYTENGSPATFNLPDTPGEYELRYVLGNSNRTLASQKVTVE